MRRLWIYSFIMSCCNQSNPVRSWKVKRWTPPEMQEKILEAMKAATTECVWDEKTSTLSQSNKVTDIKAEVQMKMNATFPLGPHAPGFTAVIYEMGEDLIRAKVMTPQGENIGIQEFRVDGKNLYSTTTLKGETASMKLERVE